MNAEELEDKKLHEAVRCGDLEEAKEALAQGDNPNKIGIYQWNALHEAANNGDLDIVKLLLKHGADPNMPDKLHGCTSLHYAAKNGYVDVLKILTSSGGLYDVCNNRNETSLDVAEGFECQKFLRQQRDKYILNHTVPSSQLKKTVLEDTKFKDKRNLNAEELTTDLDSISLVTNSSTESRPHRRAWGPDRILGINKDLIMGTIKLSFECNSKKNTFKIRVWQLADILLPPPETSMISGIYVKSYLQPDATRHSKRKTEEVRMDRSDQREIRKKGQNHIVNFQPGCFNFTKPLEYDKITRDIVSTKIIDIQVCITQKYTRKSFVLAVFNIPMYQANKKIVKEKYPLKACLSTTLPENMKVYSALDSGPHLSPLYMSRNSSGSGSVCSSEAGSWATPYPDNSGSDFDLRSVSTGYSKPSVEIEVPEDILNEIQLDKNSLAKQTENSPRHKVTFQDYWSKGSTTYSALKTVSVHSDSEKTKPDSVILFEEQPEILVHRTADSPEVHLHMPQYENRDVDSERRKPKQKKSILRKLKPLQCESSKKESKHSTQSRKALDSLSFGSGKHSIDDEEASIGVPSLAWDDYDEPAGFENLLPLDIDVYDDQQWASHSVSLPMATTFGDD